jgi:hypothetical protein
MRTLVTTGFLAALLAAPMAFADELHPALAPAAPLSPAELAQAGAGTVAGTVVALNGDGFALAELTTAGRVAVDAEHLRLDGLAAGELVTVTGVLDDGALEARHVIRADGSVAAR